MDLKIIYDLVLQEYPVYWSATLYVHGLKLCSISVDFFQVPYKVKDVELDYDNYNQVPESPIGRDEEPHLYMVPKKYRKVWLVCVCVGRGGGGVENNKSTNMGGAQMVNVSHT